MRSSAISGVSDFFSIRSGTVRASLENFRMVSVEPLTANGGMIAFTRDPSSRRASTSGDDSSMRRPTLVTIRSITRRRCGSSLNLTWLRVSFPLRSM